MEHVQILLHDDLVRFAEERAAAEGFATIDAYLPRLIEVDQDRAERERIDRLLLEGLGSGRPITADDGFWERRRKLLNPDSGS